MDKGYINFISFARGIQNGFKSDNFPLLDESEAEKEYDRVLSRFSFSFDVEKDILNQYKNGEIDKWDAIEQLEDECNLSYDEACQRVHSIFNGVIRLTPICSMAYGKEEFIPKYVLRRFRFAGYDGWIGEEENVQRGSVFARFIRGVDDNDVRILYHFVFGRGDNKSVVESPQGEAFKFKALFIQYGVKYYARKFPDSEFNDVEDVVFTNQLGAIKKLGLEEVFTASPLAYVGSSGSAFSGRSLTLNARKRKRSKYHGALVNNTFDDAPGGLSTASPASASSSIQTHPSIRYLVVSHLMHHSRRHLVKSSLSGTLDTFLLQNYCAGLGSDDPGNNIKHTGDNGRVVLSFKTDSGHSTEVDLGGSLGTGYVVAQIEDELGLFPEGTVVGDLIDNAVIQEIVRSQGERDGGSLSYDPDGAYSMASSEVSSNGSLFGWLTGLGVLPSHIIRSGRSPIFSMSRSWDDSVPSYLLKRFSFAGYNGWVGERKDIKNCNVCARYIIGENKVSPSVDLMFFFVFSRDLSSKSLSEAPSGEALKFGALFVKYGNKRFAKKFLDNDFQRVETCVFKGWEGSIKELELDEVNIVDPLIFVKSE